MSSNRSDERLATYLRKFSPSPNRETDAGLRALSHYERKLPRWRYKLRQWLIPIVRWETPYLARLQQICRSNFLDSYFAVTANLGTHTFYLTFLPICFWGGYPDFGIALVWMLAMGVVFSCVLKDLVCLPRPLSPPLQRITMSGSTALEYGFPSTHTTNAVSVAIFALYQLHLSRESLSPLNYVLLRSACYCYATSLSFGRMYCGMHGFFDVGVGAVLGASIALFRIYFGSTVDLWIINGSWTHVLSAITLLVLVVRIHPEPADNCPCFDDSISFVGVVIGICIGTWHNALRKNMLLSPHIGLAQMYPLNNSDIVKAAGRLLGGILVIFLWRAVMKPLLLTYLPGVFRFVDHWGLIIPRRYFLQARDYRNVPPLRKDDNVLPSASEIPSMLSKFRYPRRRRISVGPQSEADARELLASRQERRRKSPSAPHTGNVSTTSASTSSMAEATRTESHTGTQSRHFLTVTEEPRQTNSAEDKSTLLQPPTSDDQISNSDTEEQQKADHQMLSALEKPRTHYDVEVITKLIVYAGIAWLAVEGNPIWFERLGLT